MTRTHEELIQLICEQLEPLKSRERLGAADARPFVKAAVRQRLELTPKINSLLMPITNAGAINTAAKQFRIKFQKDKLACLLKETSPEQFKALDEQLEQLEKITGPDTRFDTSKWLTAFNAHILIQNFSQTPPTGTEGGPLRTIASLIHEYRTGEQDKDLKRACYTALKTRVARGDLDGDLGSFESENAKTQVPPKNRADLLKRV